MEFLWNFKILRFIIFLSLSKNKFTISNLIATIANFEKINCKNCKFRNLQFFFMMVKNTTNYMILKKKIAKMKIVKLEIFLIIIYFLFYILIKK